MKLLFKLYLLGQLIAMPFMIGAIGNIVNGPDKPADGAPEITSISGLTVATGIELCDTLQEGALNSVQDSIQQLRFITADLYDEDLVDEECFTSQSPKLPDAPAESRASAPSG